MREHASWLPLAALLFSACATAPLTSERYQGLSPESRTLYDKYHQFMTDGTAEAFLAAPNDDERKRLISEMHVEERVGRYPRFVQDAIWSRTPVVGMDKPALFLALGRPDNLDIEDGDPENHQLPRELWRYRRGPNANQDYVVTVINDQVVEVKAPQIK